ncbi:MAG: carbon starvation protein A [Anaeromicrobium sp.]|uniref:carbon starvation CstA family protein n=1 Tax=Anaeromicrobium sp. TaxID=1929132 RepID=UPI0025EE0D3C|nr:carbon starvation CstA family protein [Anaeromicrobium sp.]MCT4593933.1 carbon starvation protein A [Anaeromicrobium sp.]
MEILPLVIAAFVNIVANTFVSVPVAASSSVMFIILAILFGFFVYRRGMPLGISSVIGVVLLFGCIVIGVKFPLVLSKQVWIYILLGYIFTASVTPVWILLQPRDYLNSFLLYTMLIGAVLGIVIYRPTIQLPAVTSFNVGGKLLFPMLFVTVACGAISGFLSLVGSANQLLAVLALIAVAVWLKKSGKNYKMFIIPMIFMLAVTVFALILLIKQNVASENAVIVIVLVLLLLFALILTKDAYMVFASDDKEHTV